MSCNEVKILQVEFDRIGFFTTNKDVQRWVLSEIGKNKRLILKPYLKNKYCNSNKKTKKDISFL